MQFSSIMSTISRSNTCMNLRYNQGILARTNSKSRRPEDNVLSNYNRITFVTYMRMPTPPEGCYPHTSPLFVHPRREPYSFPEQQTNTVGCINRRFFFSFRLSIRFCITIISQWTLLKVQRTKICIYWLNSNLSPEFSAEQLLGMTSYFRWGQLSVRKFRYFPSLSGNCGFRNDRSFCLYGF